MPSVSNMQENINQMHTISTTMICTEQRWDITCKKLASQLHHTNEGKFRSVLMSENGILQKEQYVYWKVMQDAETK